MALLDPATGLSARSSAAQHAAEEELLALRQNSDLLMAQVPGTAPHASIPTGAEFQPVIDNEQSPVVQRHGKFGEAFDSGKRIPDCVYWSMLAFQVFRPFSTKFQGRLWQ